MSDKKAGVQKNTQNTAVEPTAPAKTATAEPVASTTLKLTADEIDDIIFIDADNPYNAGKRKERGKHYHRYGYIVNNEQVIFIVDSDHPFNRDFEDGTLTSVTLIQGTRQVTLVDPESGEENTFTRPTLHFHNSSNDRKLVSRQLREERNALHALKMQSFERAGKTTLNDEALNLLLRSTPISATE